MSDQAIVWDNELIKKYNYSGPRYTSYPTALEFHENYSEEDFSQAISSGKTKPLSLYVHIPFCHKLCYFCGCNKIVTRHQHKAEDYLDILIKEIKYRAKQFQFRSVKQMHWGGGTPTFLSYQQIRRLNDVLREHFDFVSEAEVSIELDPREISLEMIDVLYEQGFNRLSMGVQDFNKDVQKIINREQDEAFIFSLVQQARQVGFKSVNIDLIYGLPKQTVESFAITLEKIINLSPDRLSVFNYAHLTKVFPAQRRIHMNDLPVAEQKLVILHNTIMTLMQAGYQFIGMDHFAKFDNELTTAQREGQLHRNFQGYTTHGDCDLLGLGMSAISTIGQHYAQNYKELKAYNQSIEEKRNAVWKGLIMSIDDQLRGDVIRQLICNFYLDFAWVNNKYNIDFKKYFNHELQLLLPFEQDELIERNDLSLVVTAKGRLLIRNICMCFDHYLQKKDLNRFSRVI